MVECAIGSIWTVAGVEDGLVVILAGPFAEARGTPEYLVAPLYSDAEPGFAWTDEDVRLEASETGLYGVRFAAIWNARPVLREDLVLQLGMVPSEAASVLRDVYWASVNEARLGGPRLGKRIRSARERVAAFQESELNRWAGLSGRVMSSLHRVSASPLLGKISFSVPNAAPLFVSSDSLPAVLRADPLSVGDVEIFAGLLEPVWYAASNAPTHYPTIQSHFVLTNDVGLYAGPIQSIAAGLSQDDQLEKCA